MFHHVRVLLVLVIGSVGLDDAIDPVNRAGNAVAGDELGQVTAIEKHSQSDESSHRETIPKGKEKKTYRSKKSTVTPKSLAMLFNPTTR